MQQYLLVLGKTPHLSLLELASWAEARRIPLVFESVVGELAWVSGLSEQHAYALCEELGGVVKVGRAINEFTDQAKLTEQLAKCISDEVSEDAVTFGLSWHVSTASAMKQKEAEKIGLTVKSHLKENKRRVRFVQAKELILSSVQVDKNALTGPKGIEILLVQTTTGWLAARTIVVQPFEDWSNRDYGRPRRDAVSGMLPPKLARMMINMLGLPPKGVLLDPFCGSGTITTEAAVLGWPDQIATDHSARAIRDTERNVKWLKEQYKVEVTLKTGEVAISELSSVVKSNSVNAVVTEGYLGPALRKPARAKDIEKYQAELVPVYRTLLRELTRVLVDGGRAVVVMPRWVDVQGTEHSLLRLRSVLPPGLKTRHPLSDTMSSDTVPVYHRTGQYVMREIVLLERKPRH